MKLLLFFLLVFTCIQINAQKQTLILKIINSKTMQPVAGAVVKLPVLHLRSISDSNGLVKFEPLEKGKYELECEAISFHDKDLNIIIPLALKDTLATIPLDPFVDELEGVTVVSTRSNRSFNNTPTRAEIIADDEIHEEGEMRPGDIKMLLSESTGVQTQQTSATSGNASIRLQGLDGRYTQILRDGFPLYSGAATGLGILQTPPLDLRQIEIIKGSASTLYGGGAIGGIINLISKMPAEHPELSVHLNATTANGLDINSFYGKRFKNTGITVFASRNSNGAYDPAGISFSAIPQHTRYTINPKIFLYFSDHTKLNFGINSTFENRLGGDMLYIKNGGDSVHSYFERNKTKRISTQLSLDHRITDNSSISFKNSVGFYNRKIFAPAYHFDGKQVNSFSEATYTHKNVKSDWIVGINFISDHFTEKPFDAPASRNYTQYTSGFFVQNTFNASKAFIIETGLRLDHINSYGSVLLPRISTLFKITPKLTARLGGGLGYKAPTIFTEQTESILYKNILPVDPKINKLETSYGVNTDMNYRTNFGPVNLSINQLLFYTSIQNPLFLLANANGTYSLQNLQGSTITKGAETNLKFSYHELAMYFGYTYTDTKIPLTPKHRFNNAIVYEIEGKWRFGSELYYFSKQVRSDGSIGKDYWLAGFLMEKLWKHFSVYINFENLGNIRQTKFENIYTGTITKPQFKEIYAPLEGFVANGGIKFKL